MSNRARIIASVAELDAEVAAARAADDRRRHEVAQAQAHAVAERRRTRPDRIEALRPAHRAAVRRLAAALIEAASANEDLRRIVAEAGPGTGSALPAIAFPGLGRVGDPNAPVARWRKVVERLGLLDDATRDAAD